MKQINGERPYFFLKERCAPDGWGGIKLMFLRNGKDVIKTQREMYRMGDGHLSQQAREDLLIYGGGVLSYYAAGEQNFAMGAALACALWNTDRPGGDATEMITPPYNSYYIATPAFGLLVTHDAVNLETMKKDCELMLFVRGESVSEPRTYMKSSGVGDKFSSFDECLCLYLNSNNAITQTVRPAQENHKNGRKKTRRIARRNSATITYVGGDSHQSPKTIGGAGHNGNIAAHWVRGHFHRYWVGPGREKLDIKWIAPFPKGTGTPGSRIYKLRGSPSHDPIGSDNQAGEQKPV